MIAQVHAASPSLILSTKLGLVSVPDADIGSLSMEEELDRDSARELLHTLGGNLGLSVLARQEERFPESEAATSANDKIDFPDEAVRKSLEGLDAVWTKDGEAVACFAVESGFGGWEGIRRLADLLALHPKLKAPLYAVTLPALKTGLAAEAHRPIFCQSKKPLAECLRLLEWDRLKSEVNQLGERVRYLKPEFLEGISERILPPKAD